MHIHYLKHVPFEGLGSMEHVFVAEGIVFQTRAVITTSQCPRHDIDALVIWRTDGRA